MFSDDFPLPLGHDESRGQISETCQVAQDIGIDRGKPRGTQDPKPHPAAQKQWNYPWKMVIFHRFWYVYQLSKFGDRISKLVRLPNSNDSLWLAAMAYITRVFMGVMFTNRHSVNRGPTLWRLDSVFFTGMTRPCLNIIKIIG